MQPPLPVSLLSCLICLISFPLLDLFSLMPSNSAMDTLLCTLSSSVDSLCPLTPLAVWLSVSMHVDWTILLSTEWKWWKSNHFEDPTASQSLLSYFSSSLTVDKSSFLQSKIQSSLSKPINLTVKAARVNLLLRKVTLNLLDVKKYRHSLSFSNSMLSPV